MGQQCYSYIFRPRWYARRIPGPKPYSWAYGHIRMLGQDSPGVVLRKWFEEYGPVVHFQGFLGVNRFGHLVHRCG